MNPVCAIKIGGMKRRVRRDERNPRDHMDRPPESYPSRRGVVRIVIWGRKKNNYLYETRKNDGKIGERLPCPMSGNPVGIMLLAPPPSPPPLCDHTASGVHEQVTPQVCIHAYHYVACVCGGGIFHVGGGQMDGRHGTCEYIDL